MRRFFILLAAYAVTGCAASRSSPSSEHTDSPVLAPELVQHGHAAVDLSGTWATGSVGEPTVQRIVLPVQCNYTPPLWILQQYGDTVRVWAFPASYSQGIATRQSISTVGAAGRVSGVDLTTSTAGARYVLRYDSTSGHLRGTLNGAPFWAVREEIVRPNDCIPVP